MTWTKETPTKEGMYWYGRSDPAYRPTIKEVFMVDDIAYVKHYTDEPALPCSALCGNWQYIPLPSHPL